jgi:hypothetical protein
MYRFIKNILKRYFLIFQIRNRLSPSVQLAQRIIYLHYKDCLNHNNIPKITDTGFRVFSQYEEDGLLLFIFSIIGMGSKRFIDIGSDDGINSNAANLFFNFGWHGVFIDANKTSISRGIRFYNRYPHPNFYKPIFICQKVTSYNINEIIEKTGYVSDIELLSIDLDGNDYWIWDAIQIVMPKVVIIEVHNEFGMEDIVVPYDPDYFYPGKHPLYHGASAVAMTKMAKRKGYRLVGANDLGFNFIYLRNDLAQDIITEVDIESLLQHPNAQKGREGFKEIKDWDFVRNI